MRRRQVKWNAQLWCREPTNDHNCTGSTVAVLLYKVRPWSFGDPVLTRLDSPECSVGLPAGSCTNSTKELTMHVLLTTTYGLMTWRRKQLKRGSHGREYSPRSTAAVVVALHGKVWALAVTIMINICAGEVSPYKLCTVPPSD